VWQCLICGEYGTESEACRWCSSEALEWVQAEDGQEWGYLKMSLCALCISSE
jgi:hypothetical protein